MSNCKRSRLHRSHDGRRQPRDTLADLKLLGPVCAKLGSQATLHVIETADHSFHVLKSSGSNDAEVLRELTETAVFWAEGIEEIQSSANNFLGGDIR